MKLHDVGSRIRLISNLLKREVGGSESGKYVDEATGTNAFVIGYLASHTEKDVFQRDLEEWFSVRRSTMSGILLRMEEKGFLVRTPVPYDARLKKLTLTEKGWYVHKMMVGAIESAEEKLLCGLSAEEIETLAALLERLRRNLESESACRDSEK